MYPQSTHSNRKYKPFPTLTRTVSCNYHATRLQIIIKFVKENVSFRGVLFRCIALELGVGYVVPDCQCSEALSCLVSLQLAQCSCHVVHECCPSSAGIKLNPARPMVSRVIDQNFSKQIVRAFAKICSKRGEITQKNDIDKNISCYPVMSCRVQWRDHKRVFDLGVLNFNSVENPIIQKY